MWCGIRWLGGIDKNFRLTEYRAGTNGGVFEARTCVFAEKGLRRERAQPECPVGQGIEYLTVAGVGGAASHIC
jgi:hypothetical protein